MYIFHEYCEVEITYVSISNYATLGVDLWYYAPQTPYTRRRCSSLVKQYIIDLIPFIIGMPAGLKQTSSSVSVGFQVDESAANTFTQGSIDLNLSPLDREVFVVTAINLDPTAPDNVDKTNTAVAASLTTTSQTAVSNLSNANCMATANLDIRSVQGTGIAVPFTRNGMETPPATLEYIGIIATNDFFVQIQGTSNSGAKRVSGKLYGYRAAASADIYAALVQSEVLSA